ncbi:MAG: type II toxin-antitoxin system Phd/YefM family antitoxin [Thermoanaerobaculia bacterium]|nr:type II toxin-antitoxin system Phd/YefM family antitoxin [Thermoanaerobaculia bacterium]
MAKKIGVRELKNRASSVVQEVREQMAEYVVTVHEHPVAVIRPYTDQDAQGDRRRARVQALAGMKRLAQEVGSRWVASQSAVDLIDEQRR